MPLKMLCASHAHLMDYPGLVPDKVASEARAAVAGHTRRVEAYAPELVIKIGDDHASGFGLKLMPPFTIGVRAHGVGDFHCSAGPLSTDEPVARELIAFLHEYGVDVSYSYDMPVDHGIVQLLDHYFGGVDRVPVVPVMVNCGGDLRPPLKRTRALGQAIGHYLREHQSDKRVLVVGSGGLSHDPPLPVFTESPPDVQARIIAGPPQWTPETMAARVERVLEFAREHGRGEGPLLPLDPEWDESILGLFAARDLDSLCALPDAEVVARGGRGAAEIRNWIAAFAVLEAYTGGDYRAVQDYYRAIPGWIVGFAMMHGSTEGDW
ncbi:MAG: 3-carboxyethylcatechol 2,3-dioxygenase [Halioglobus sp.]